MTRYKNSGDGVQKLRVTMLIVSLAAVSIAVGAAFSLGIFSQNEPETREPLRITISSDRLDFGDLNLNDIATRQLILRNDGERPLNAKIRAGDSNLRISPDQLILHPGVGSRVMVELIGKRTGGFEDELRIMVDDADADPLVVALAGRVWRDDTERPKPKVTDTHSLVAERRQAGPGAPAGADARQAEPQAERREAAGTSAETSAESDGSITVTNASVNRRDPSQPAAGGTAAAVSSSSRRPAASGGPTPSQANRPSAASPEGANRSMVRVTTYDPATSAPYRSLAERPLPIPEQISDEEAANASKIPSKTPTGQDGEELPDRLPDEPSLDDDDSRDRDLRDRDDDHDPFVSPTLTISGQSVVRVLGGTAQFYPQAINVVGTDMGGPIGLMSAIEFPTVPLAFGESMLFAQLGAGASGGWDPMTGDVHIAVPIQAVDADGDAAPLLDLVFTTGTLMRRNESGNVVAITGAPRNPGSGLLKLVGIAKIPVGHRNGGEEHLVIFEILASLTFGTSISSSDLTPMDRIGG